MSETTRTNQPEKSTRIVPKAKREGILKTRHATDRQIAVGGSLDEQQSVPSAGLVHDFSIIPSHTKSAPFGLIQRDGPTGTVETSEGTEEIEGTEVTSSATSIQERLDNNESDINEWILDKTNDGVGALSDGIQIASRSFMNWYEGRPDRPNSAGFILSVAAAAIGIIGAAFPPAGLAMAIAGALVGIASDPIKNALDPNSEPDDQARQLEQNMLRIANRLPPTFAGFGPRLRADRADVWNDIGIAFTMDPPLYSIARETLESSAGVPQVDQPHGERILSEMIYTYTDWEARHELEESTFFISSGSVEYALFTEQARRRFREAATREAGRRLGAPEEESSR